MNINKIGGNFGNYPSGNFAKIQKDNQVSADSVNISEAAKSQFSLQQALEVVKSTADIRQDKVESARNNLATYFTEGNINSEVTEKIAKKIAEDMSQGLI